MENSIFIKTFGDYPLIRVLDFLIYSRDFDYPITEIAKNSNVNFLTIKKIWPQLEKNKFVISTRTLGNGKLFKINEKNPVVVKLIELNKFLCLQFADKLMQKEKIIA